MERQLGFFDIDEPDMDDTDIDVFDIDCSEFEGDDTDIDDLDFGFETDQKRYINPGRKQIVSKPVKYRNALVLAKQIGDIGIDDRYFIFLDGNFIFGDFIEAWIVENHWNVTNMIISTLSLSENNVDSLRNLLEWDYLQNLEMIVSDYFFGHERHNLIPYMYQELDLDNNFQLAVARVHTKICLIETECGKRIIIHGSANLRTSKNVEQIVIECDQDLYKFNWQWHREIIERYKTINKTVGAKELWHQDQLNTQRSTRQEKQRQNQGERSQKPGRSQARQSRDEKAPEKEKAMSRSKAW